MTTSPTRASLTTRLLRAVCALGAVSIVATSLVTVTPVVEATAAEPGISSAVTVKWAGGNDPAIQQYQVPRSDDPNGTLVRSGHYDDFKDLQITVSKTKNVTDEALIVDVSGMDATFEQFSLNSNFLQLMQCWGPDPLEQTFPQTCQYGSYSDQAGDRAGATVIAGSNTSISVGHRGDQFEIADNGFRRSGEPFEAVNGSRNEPRTFKSDAGETLPADNGLASFFTSRTSNERPVEKIPASGQTRIALEVQSSASQPYLGCGTPQAQRCWLVVVPRGTHSGTFESGTTPCGSAEAVSNEYGDSTFSQFGSPLDSNCSFWSNRVVIPLDFQSNDGGCPPGSPERRVLGTELASAALSSWQSTLCAVPGGAAYSLVTNPGRIVRDQLVTGQGGLGLTLKPVTRETVSEENASALDGTRIRYAPVANTGIGIAFISERNAIKRTSINLSPRLLAKLLTMSYASAAPRDGISSADPAHVSGNPKTVWDDPELAKVNSAVNEQEFRSNGGTIGSGQIVLAGPQGEDVVAAVWAYIRSDDAARAFLRGEPDESGMRINPYFLPSTNPAALGGGLEVDLSIDDVDIFPKADQTVAPDKVIADEKYKGQQIDAILMNPYSATLDAVSQRILRGNTGSPEYDALKLNSAQEQGAWTTSPSFAGVGAGKHLFGATDLSSASRYGLSFASLQRPNSDEFVAPTDEALAKAGRSAVSDDLSAITLPNAAETPPGGYPLTTTIFAATDIDNVSLDGNAREQYAALLDYAGGDGQQPGENRGQLPRGYVPLTDTQRAQANALAALIRNPGTPETPEEEGSAPPAAVNSGSSVAAPPAGAAATSPSTVTGVTTTANASSSETSTGISSVGLGGALVAGLAGLVLSPFLLRRRGVTR